MWNGKENRKDAIKLEDFNKLDLKVAVFTEKVTNWMDTTKDYREGLCDKLDVIVKEISNVNTRCFDRTEDYILIKEHIKNSNNFKSLWQDRNFKVLFALVSPIYITFVGIIVNWLWHK